MIPKLPKNKPLTAWYLFVVVGVAALTYSNAASNGFAFDDSAAVVKNPDVNPSSPLNLLLHRDFWGQDIISPRSHKSFRPLTVLSFRINRLLCEGWNANYTASNGDLLHTPDSLAWNFHAVNIILHTIVCLLIFWIALKVLNCDENGSLIASTLFASHPVHTEAVTGIVGRADLLCSIFCLFSYLCFAKSSSSNHTSTHWFTFTLCLINIIAASMCKEIGVTIVAVLFVHDLIIGSEIFPPLGAILRCKIQDSLPENAKERFKSFILRQLFLFITAIALLQYRKYVTISFKVSGHMRALENPIMMTSGNPMAFLCSIGMLHTKYMQQLLFPITLSADWSYNALPLIFSWKDPMNIWTILMYTLLFSIIIFCLFKVKQDEKYYLIALAWLVATFMPSTQIFFYVGTMVGERLLYVPSVGFCIVIGKLLGSGIQRGFFIRTLCITLSLTLIVAYSYRAYIRNPDWKDNETLFKATVLSVPNSAKAQMMYGEELQSHQLWRESVPYLKKALEIWPDYCDVHHSLGASLYQIGDFGTGIALMHKGLDCWPSKVSAATNLNAIYNDIIHRNPNNMSAILGWADVLAKIDREREASEYYTSVAVKFWESGDHSKALSLSEKACNISKNHCESQLWFGIMLLEIGKDSEAFEHLFASSFKENCTKTYLPSLDKLIGLYNKLHDKSNNKKSTLKIDEKWIPIIVRAQNAAAEQQKETKKQN